MMEEAKTEALFASAHSAILGLDTSLVYIETDY